MTSFLNRFIFSHDFVGQQSWNLLKWCGTHGASEFTLAMLSLQDSPAPFLDGAEKLLEPFVLPAAPREFVIGEPLVRPATLWSLSQESIAALKHLFPDGLFMYPTSEWEQGCIEDPTFYRQGRFFLGIVSHEHEGKLTVSEAELVELERAGYRMSEHSEWL